MQFRRAFFMLSVLAIAAALLPLVFGPAQARDPAAHHVHHAHHGDHAAHRHARTDAAQLHRISDSRATGPRRQTAPDMPCHMPAAKDQPHCPPCFISPQVLASGVLVRDPGMERLAELALVAAPCVSVNALCAIDHGRTARWGLSHAPPERGDLINRTGRYRI